METTSKMKCEFKPLPGERWKRFMGHYAVSSEGRFASALRPGKGERVRSFRTKPFPTDWARVVAGVGLASFSMRVEDGLFDISMVGVWKPDYLRCIALAQSKAQELREFLSVRPVPPGTAAGAPAVLRRAQVPRRRCDRPHRYLVGCR